MQSPQGTFNISRESIEKFKSLMEQEGYGSITDEQAKESAESLVRLFAMLTTNVGVQVATQVVKATQVGNNVRIDLSQLKHPIKSILYVAQNGQVLADPESWVLDGETILFYEAGDQDQFLVQYAY